MSLFIERVKYAIEDIHLSITDVFLYSTRFGKLINNAHDSSYEFMNGWGKDVCEKYELSSIYTLSAIYTIDYDNVWQGILSKSQYNLFEENGEYILGFIVIHPRLSGCEGEGEGDYWATPISYNNTIHFIDFMDTRISRYHLGAFMIKLYECMFAYGVNGNADGCIACLPYKINMKSAVYWRKYFEKHNIFTCDDLRFIIKEYGIFGKIDWDILLEEYSIHNTSIWRK